MDEFTQRWNDILRFLEIHLHEEMDIEREDQFIHISYCASAIISHLFMKNDQINRENSLNACIYFLEYTEKLIDEYNQLRNIS